MGRDRRGGCDGGASQRPSSHAFGHTEAQTFSFGLHRGRLGVCMPGVSKQAKIAVLNFRVAWRKLRSHRAGCDRDIPALSLAKRKALYPVGAVVCRWRQLSGVFCEAHARNRPAHYIIVATGDLGAMRWVFGMVRASVWSVPKSGLRMMLPSFLDRQAKQHRCSSGL